MTAPQNRDLPTLHEGEYWIQPLKIPRLDNHKVTLLSAHFGSPLPQTPKGLVLRWLWAFLSLVPVTLSSTHQTEISIQVEIDIILQPL